MTDRVHGGVLNGETLTGDMDFFTVHTLIALEEGDWTATNNESRNLDVMTRAISLGAQPVLVSVSEAEVDLSDAPTATEYDFGTDYNQAATTVYTYKFAIEHRGALGDASGEDRDATDESVPGTLANYLDGLELPLKLRMFQLLVLALEIWIQLI